MRIGVLCEQGRGKGSERRVALTPRCAGELVRAGHEVFVERGAGANAGFRDLEYELVGARVVQRRLEALARAQLLAGIRWLDAADVALLPEGAIAFTLHRLDIAPKQVRAAHRDAGVIGVSADRLRDETGHYPIVGCMAELAGALAPQLACRLLESTGPGRPGVLLARISGLAPPEIVVIGAGALGATAARGFAGLGASVHLLDRDLRRLQRLAPTLPPNVSTVLATGDTVDRMVSFANVVVTAIREPGERSAVIIREDLVKRMRNGAVILDFSIDEGGAVETSRPVSDPEDAYLVHGVLHFCMPNTPSLVARTASRLLSRAYVPFLLRLASGADPAADPLIGPAIWDPNGAAEDPR